MPTPEKRKGSKSIATIPPAILTQLNNGDIETANLVEWLAIHQATLLTNVLNQLKRKNYVASILKAVDGLTKQTVNTLNQTIGQGLLAFCKDDKELLPILSTHTADMVRCWATHVIGGNPKLTIKQKLQQIQPFAADQHFGVREIAWLAVRPSIAINLEESIAILATWTTHKNDGIRRFTSEATRPRGVWCEHIDALKENPTIALPILTALKNDEAKYVQDSVGNWLNDASKTQPQFVTQLCKKWEKESNTKNTTYIIKKALRTLEK
jgi:3-methyladenine DNA glycosylase AlkC